MRKTFDFGKVDGYGRGRNNCQVTAEMKWEDGNFSASANVWNNLGTDIIMGGQCIDTLYRDYPELRNNAEFCELKDLWEKYHLNDMKAGTTEQEAAVKDWKAQGNAYDYEKVCEYLKSIDLYEVKVDGMEEPYRYGTAWLKEEVPEQDVKRIENLISGKFLEADISEEAEEEMEM